MKRTSKTALTLAAAAAALFATGCSSLCAEPCEALVKCAPCEQSCKGNCAQANACKGKQQHHHHGHSHKGFTYMTRSECLASGGRVIE